MPLRLFLLPFVGASLIPSFFLLSSLYSPFFNSTSRHLSASPFPSSHDSRLPFPCLRQPSLSSLNLFRCLLLHLPPSFVFLLPKPPPSAFPAAPSLAVILSITFSHTLPITPFLHPEHPFRLPVPHHFTLLSSFPSFSNPIPALTNTHHASNTPPSPQEHTINENTHSLLQSFTSSASLV